MDTAWQTPVIALIISGIIGGLVSGFIKLYFDYKSKITENIWEKRLNAYLVFVKLTALFPQYPKREVTWNEVYDRSLHFRDWYFEGAGLFLSNRIRNNYFDLQDLISSLLKVRNKEEQQLSEPDYEKLRQKCSQIRSLMATELESRESPFWYRFKKRREV